MTRKQREIRNRWLRRIGWIAIFALGFQTAAPAADAGIRTATRHYRAWQAQRAQQRRMPPDMRVLRKSEMLVLKGRGRIPSLAGQAKWDIIDNGVNLRTRNYTYTATDLTLPGAIGIPVSVVRTWNANDDREGPFGIGWSWSLDVRQAAGGLIKRKAAPSRTVPIHMNNGRKLNIVKIEALSGAPFRQEIQLDGIQCQDFSGEQWVAWRDADGLYTPPPWDHNEYESTYTTITYTQNGEEFMRDYALSTKVTTPDGTVYYYEAVMQGEGPNRKPVAFDAEGNEAYTEQVLMWVEDRFGNRTTYTYILVDNVEHTYYVPGATSPRSITVRKAFVKTITNASGFTLTVNWNFENGGGYVNGVLKHPRVTSVVSSDGRTVRYWYGPSGNETGEQNWTGSVTAVENTSGVLVTRYQYDSWAVDQSWCDYLNQFGISCSESYLLTGIIDADGATTTITYNTGSNPETDPNYYYRVVVRRVTLPSGVIFEFPFPGVVLAYFNGRQCVARGIAFTEDDHESVTVTESALYPNDFQYGFGLLKHMRRYNRLWQWLVSEEWTKPGWATVAIDRIWCVGDQNDPDPDSIFGQIPEFAHKAIWEDVRALPILWMGELRNGMIMGDLNFLKSLYEYNCLGQPIQIRTIARSWYQPDPQSLTDLDHTRTITYHGKEFYYQKASESETVRGQRRTVLYHYYDRGDRRPGYQGQMYAVFATHLNTGNLPLSEVLEYNQFGQPTLTRALQRAAGNNSRWVYTKTEYDPLFHQPSKVIEDYRYPNDPIARQHGINRIQITEYDAHGRPYYQATYAPNPNNPELPGALIRRIETVYDPVTEQVKEIWRVDANNNRLQLLASYTYTAGGRMTSATDHLSRITTEIEYYTPTMQVAEMRELWSEGANRRLRYRMNYYYAINGVGGDLRRKTLTLPDNQQYQWDYGHYLTGITFPLQHVFTRVVMRGPGLVQPQVVDYLYDPQTMRLRAARFAVQPITDSEDPLYERGNARALGMEHPDNLGIALFNQFPQSFAFAWYAYDGAGRLTELRYYLASLKSRDDRFSDNYNYAPLSRFLYLAGNAPAYDEAGNRFLMAAYDHNNLVRTESYEYDELDRLTGVSYNGGLWQRWTYDVMGNRYGQGNPAYDGLNRLTQFNGAAIQHDLLGNLLQDGRYLYQWDVLNRLVGMQAYQSSGRFKVVGDSWRFGYRADGLRVFKERVSAVSLEGAGGTQRTEYLYDGQMPVMEQDFEGGVLKQSRVNLLGARGIEAVVTIDHTQGNQATRRWLLYDGHGNLVRLMAPDYTLSSWQWRGVWGEVQSSLGTSRGYCANLGHPEDETGLVYMRARYYEPLTGRFLSEDPSRDGVNWYLYADGNPVNKVDFEGRRSSGDKPDWLVKLAHYYAAGDYDSVALMIQLIAEYVLGVDSSTAEAIGDLVKNILEGLNLAAGKRAARKVVEKTGGLWDNIIEHAKKLLDEPNSSAANHWKDEIETWLKTIYRRVVE